LEPRNFSFNNPHGACPRCEGLGQVWEFDPALLVPDRRWIVTKVLARLKEQTGGCAKLPALDRKTLDALAAAFPYPQGAPWTARPPVGDWPAAAFEALLYGTEATQPPFPGLIPALRRCVAEAGDDEAGEAVKEEVLAFAGYVTCPECGGARL